jgi:hypothetical protein
MGEDKREPKTKHDALPGELALDDLDQVSGGIVFPDVCKVPAPTGPVPIPFPNIATTTDPKIIPKKIP